MTFLLRHRRLLGLLTVVILCLRPSLAVGADAEAADSKLYQGLLTSSVWVHLVKKTEASGKIEFLSGSGALIDIKHRLVITNYHVVRDKEDAFVLFPILQGNKVVREKSLYQSQILKGIPGKVTARDPVHDLALIRLSLVPPGATALRLASKGVALGERVHSLGNPGESDKLWVFHTGMVQQLLREKIEGKTIDGFVTKIEAKVVLTDSTTKPGESGGPLINEHGELAGVTHGHRTSKTNDKETDQGVFIDLSDVRNFLETQKLIAQAPAPVVREKDVVVKSRATGEKPSSKPGTDPDDVEQTAARRLRLARSLVTDGKTEKATERFEEIIKQFPKTKAAADARQLLEKMNK